VLRGANRERIMTGVKRQNFLNLTARMLSADHCTAPMKANIATLQNRTWALRGDHHFLLP
jgi:hypothetical protein